MHYHDLNNKIQWEEIGIIIIIINTNKNYLHTLENMVTSKRASISYNENTLIISSTDPSVDLNKVRMEIK
jgi:hypothetical protein